MPGPEIRVKQGETLHARVDNRLPEGTTIHWHGQPIVNDMDGVPDVTQPPIGSGEQFTYDFVVPAAGTYFYHSHVGLQLDRGVYGPLIVEPENETLSYDKEFTLMLDDWLDGVDGRTPQDELENLRSGGSEMAGMDMGGGGMEGAGGEPARTPPDTIYPYYFINGKPPERPEELEVRRGDRVRLRLINAASATISGRPRRTQADRRPHRRPARRAGRGRRRAPRSGRTLRRARRGDQPRRMAARRRGRGHGEDGPRRLPLPGSSVSAPAPDRMPSELKGNLLTYDMLRAASEAETVPGGEPDETIPLTLDGDEEEYTWSINGQRFPDADRLSVNRDDLIRFEYRNMSEMPHPMHLHGHFFRVENGTGNGPIKDTVMVEPMQTLATDWLADNPGAWALHCHLIYHMERGMMRVVDVG